MSDDENACAEWRAYEVEANLGGTDGAASAEAVAERRARKWRARATEMRARAAERYVRETVRRAQ